ncbi:DNA polymerase I [Paralimibaculum aggregatum]|uniref:DNA polymerase I n=1 Tax=Paralimibaculum aggregatum TaxID=3036245 RepID=A0ABQ6LGU5_9RHOB|nr:DNA polymerase I [Limibaculum sp. NKW23]GMG82515.1 DNA polymerase I [Limibaculum sp. NKW23]
MAEARAPRPLGKGDLLYLVDGSGFIFRAYFQAANRDAKYNFRSDGTPTGAVNMFCAMLHSEMGLASSRGPTHFAVIFDHSSESFRNALYPAYKANRTEPPEDLRPQFALIREATRAFGLPCIEMQGYEADDLIATYATQAAAAGAAVTILSSDKDLMQLVSPAVHLRDPMKKVDIGPEEVAAKFGVAPERVVDVQALAGDSVDNIPGAPGIGVKTAAQLIGEYGDLDTLLARAGEIRQPKRRQTLIEKADQIRLSRELVTLKRDVPVETGLEAMSLEKPDPEALLGFLAEMEFRTLTSRIAETLGAEPPAVVPRAEAAGGSGAAGASSPPGAGHAALGGAPGARIDLPDLEAAVHEVVRDPGTLEAWIAEAREAGRLCIDLETTSLDEMVAEIVGIALSVVPGRAAYVPVGHTTGEGDLLGASERVEGQLALEDALARLGPLLADPSILKIGQNLKYDMKVLARHGLAVAPIDDTMLISYALDSGRGGHGMDELSERHLGHKPIPIKELIGSGKSAITFDRVEIDKAAGYAAEDAEVTLRLWHVLRPRLAAERVSTVYHTLERPLVPVLAEMERAGIRIDRDELARQSTRFAQKMAEYEDEIHKLAGRSFNVGSPKQLGEILFDEQGLPGGKKGKAGAWGTGADVLESLAAQGHELPARVLDWRQLSKLRSTYTDALPTHVNAETGRVHTSFSLAATSTGRLASTDPNLQNIPVRTEEGRGIRRAFVAEPGNLILSLDYSQIELRILAHVAGIDALKAAFREGQDIHAMTASEVFGVPVEGMDPMVRRQAKAINFGVIYGISAFGLANNLRIPQGEAKAFIDAYFERFPGIRDYMEATKATARENGYVETLFGRRIHTPGIAQKGPGRGFAERAAINAPIQGSAADVIRRAMIRIPEALAAAKLSGRMLLQVHDELLFEVPEAEAADTVAVVRRVMEEAAEPAVKLDVPLVVDAGQGASWAEAH